MSVGEERCVKMVDRNILMLRSLGFFIQKKRRADRALGKDAFLASGDYHDFLKDVEPAVQASADDFEDSIGEKPMSLDDIDLSQLQYEDVV